MRLFEMLKDTQVPEVPEFLADGPGEIAEELGLLPDELRALVTLRSQLLDELDTQLPDEDDWPCESSKKKVDLRRAFKAVESLLEYELNFLFRFDEGKEIVYIFTNDWKVWMSCNCRACQARREGLPPLLVLGLLDR